MGEAQASFPGSDTTCVTLPREKTMLVATQTPSQTKA